MRTASDFAVDPTGIRKCAPAFCERTEAARATRFTPHEASAPPDLGGRRTQWYDLPQAASLRAEQAADEPPTGQAADRRTNGPKPQQARYFCHSGHTRSVGSGSSGTIIHTVWRTTGR